MDSPIAVGVTKAHDVGMTDKAQRRRFTAAYKLNVLDEAAGCRAPGELGGAAPPGRLV